MKSNSTIKRFLCSVICLLIIAALTPFSGFSAEVKEKIVFDCAYEPIQKTLTVTASVVNPGIKVNTAMFMLDYDTALLDVDSSSVSFLGNASESAVYSSTGHIGADWYYDSGLVKSESKTPSVRIVFTVKDGAAENKLKTALSICEHADTLNAAGGYGSDGGMLLCESSSVFKNAAGNTVVPEFNYARAELPDSKKNRIIFTSVYDAASKTMTTTASVSNPTVKVGSAMFVLKYDSSLLTPTVPSGSSTKNEDMVKYLGGAKKSRTYVPSGKDYIGADWYYDTALPVSSTPTDAVLMQFAVKNGATEEQLKNALSLCDDSDYLKSIKYDKYGSVLLCSNGENIYSPADSTADAVFRLTSASSPDDNTKPGIIFRSVYYPDRNYVTTTAAIDNPGIKVGSAMFVLKYDSSILTPMIPSGSSTKTEDMVKYLGGAKKSRTYVPSNKDYIGADWYYDTALPASSTPTDAVIMQFAVKNGATEAQVKNALAVCDDRDYLKSLGYSSTGGVLLCANGEEIYSLGADTAKASFEISSKATPSPEPKDEEPVDPTTTTDPKKDDKPSTSTTTPTTKDSAGVTTGTKPYQSNGDRTGDSFAVLYYAAALFMISALVAFGIIIKNRISPDDREK